MFHRRLSPLRFHARGSRARERRGAFDTVRRITIPLLAPAILAAANVFLHQQHGPFEAGPRRRTAGRVFLLPTLIYFTAQMGAPPNYGLGAVYSVLFMGLMIVVLIL